MIILPMDWISPKFIIAKYLSCSPDPTSNSETTNFDVLQFFDKSDKGQLISKRLFGIFNSSKKGTKDLDFTTILPQVELFSFIFWEK